MKHRHIVIMLGIVVIAVLRASGLAWADESEHYAAAQKEIVFLLDTSVSMAAQDKEQKVTDAIRQAVYGLPSYAQAGFVAYNTEIQAAIPIGAKTEQIEEQLGAIVYGGYTNAGEGLSQAVKLFSGSRENKESYIVMLTDGEISGKHFAVFEMENPEPGSIDITYGITGEDLSEAYWIFDYAVIPLVSAKDPSEEMSQLMVIPFHSDENPPPQKVIHYWPLYHILSILMQFILILLIIWSWKKKQAADDTTKPRELKELPKKRGDKRELFSGKLSLYMIRTADGRDVPPQTYRLFGCEPGEMTLAQILKSCGIELGKIGGENIILYPGLNHAVMFKDLSESCTVMRGWRSWRKTGHIQFITKRRLPSYLKMRKRRWRFTIEIREKFSRNFVTI